MLARSSVCFFASSRRALFIAKASKSKTRKSAKKIKTSVEKSAKVRPKVTEVLKVR